MEDIETLAQRVASNRRELDSALGEARAVLSRGKELENEILRLTTENETLEQVAVLLNSLGEERQAQAQGTIETLVTEGLQTIFDDSLTFHIVSTQKAKTSGIEFVVRSALSTTAVETPVMEARGGGLSATIGFLLRTVVMLLSASERRENLLVLDETFAHVSAEYLESLGQFLRQIVDRSGIQILLVTHQPEFLEHADKAYKFSTKDGRTVVNDVA